MHLEADGALADDAADIAAPMTPSVLPVISTPMNFDFSHLPAWVEGRRREAGGRRRTSCATACSAVVIELPKGVFMTMMPRREAAGISTLSTPMPARPMTLRLVAAAISFSVALVAERIARPS